MINPFIFLFNQKKSTVFYDGRKKMLRMLQNGQEKGISKEKNFKKEKIICFFYFFDENDGETLVAHKKRDSC
jgi:hypothetical protein